MYKILYFIKKAYDCFYIMPCFLPLGIVSSNSYSNINPPRKYIFYKNQGIIIIIIFKNKSSAYNYYFFFTTLPLQKLKKKKNAMTSMTKNSKKIVEKY